MRAVVARVVIDVSCALGLHRSNEEKKKYSSRWFLAYLKLLQQKVTREARCDKSQIEFIFLTQAQNHAARQFCKIFVDENQELISYALLEKYLEKQGLLEFWQAARKMPIISAEHKILSESFSEINDSLPTFVWLAHPTKIVGTPPGNSHYFHSHRSGGLEPSHVRGVHYYLRKHSEEPFKRIVVYCDFDDTLLRKNLLLFTRQAIHALNPELLTFLTKIFDVIPKAEFNVLTSRTPFHHLLSNNFLILNLLLEDLNELNVEIDIALSRRLKEIQANLSVVFKLVKEGKLDWRMEMEALKKISVAAHEPLLQDLKHIEEKVLAALLEEDQKKFFMDTVFRIRKRALKRKTMLDFCHIPEICKQYEEKIPGLKFKASNEMHLGGQDPKRSKLEYIADAHKGDSERTLIVFIENSNKEVRQFSSIRLPAGVNISLVKANIDGEWLLGATLALNHFVESIRDALNPGKKAWNLFIPPKDTGEVSRPEFSEVMEL